MSLSTVITRKLSVSSVWLVFLFFLAYLLLLIFAQSPNIAGVENNTVYFIQQLLDENVLYTDPALPPYSISQYGPLYYYLVAGIAKLTGVHPEDVMTIFKISRAVSILLFLATAFSAYLVGRKVFQFSSHRSWLLFAIVFIFFEISSFARADSLANALYFFSLFLFMLGLTRLETGKSRNLFILAAMVAGLAFFSKQSSLTLPLICGLQLLLLKQYRYFLYYTASLVSVFIVGLLFIQMTSGIDIFYRNVIKGVDNGFDISTYLGYILRDFMGANGLLWLSLMTLSAMIMRKRKDVLSRFLSLVVILQFVFSMVLALKKGSSSNYFTEWWILVLLATAWCWTEIAGMLTNIDKNCAYILIMIVLFFRASTIVYPLFQQISAGYKIAGSMKFEEEKAIAKLIKDKMGQEPQLVYNNIFSPDTYLNNLLFREAIMPQHDIVVFGTYYRDVFDYTYFREQIANGSVGFIIDKPGEQAAVKLKIDMRSYKEIAVIGAYHIYQTIGKINK